MAEQYRNQIIEMIDKIEDESFLRYISHLIWEWINRGEKR